MLEKSIEQWLMHNLRRRGALVYKFISPGQAGVPDRIAVLPGGRCVFIELKRYDGRMSKLQLWHRKRLQYLGAEVYVVYSMEEARELVDFLLPARAHTLGGDV